MLACTQCKGYIVEGMWKPFVSQDHLEAGLISCDTELKCNIAVG